MATNNANDFSNPLAISQGGTNASSMSTTDGVVYYNGTSLVVTNAGIAGQLLTSNGAGNAPTWQAGGGGAPSGQGWDLIQTQTFPGNALTFTTGITNAYNTYAFIYSYGNSPRLTMRYSTNGGSSYVATGYNATASDLDFFSTYAPADSDTTQAIINIPFGGGRAFGSVIYLFQVTSGANCALLGLGSNDRRFNMCYASLGNSSPINALQFLGGAPGGAVISLYGVNE